MSVNLASLSSAPATTGKKGVIWAHVHIVLLNLLLGTSLARNESDEL